MSVGDKPAFQEREETPAPDGGCYTDYTEGMTYRQWLIGKALSNPNIESMFDGDADWGENAIAAADNAIAILDAEDE